MLWDGVSRQYCEKEKDQWLKKGEVCHADALYGIVLAGWSCARRAPLPSAACESGTVGEPCDVAAASDGDKH